MLNEAQLCKICSCEQTIKRIQHSTLTPHYDKSHQIHQNASFGLISKKDSTEKQNGRNGCENIYLQTVNE
jgi:hypothetical protein